MKSILRHKELGLLAALLLALPAHAVVTHYAYDEAGRLLQAGYGAGQTIDYAYDANGNLLVRSASSGTDHLLVYGSTAGGTIVGATTQLVAHGGSGTTVTALTNLYYAFTQWSDGFGTETRTDTNVQANISVIAQFAAVLAAQGTPHWWLAEHGYTTNLNEAELSDDDTDTFTAGDEYVADTNPNNPTSYFRIVAISNGPPVTVYFDPGSTGRIYTFQFIDDMTSGTWSNIAGAPPRPGAGGTDSVDDTNAAPFRVHRIQVELP